MRSPSISFFPLSHKTAAPAQLASQLLYQRRNRRIEIDAHEFGTRREYADILAYRFLHDGGAEPLCDLFLYGFER